jgi:predicted RNase H-like HicB family nuclease
MLVPIAIYQGPGRIFGVIVPDIPGCFSAGDTLAEARMNACEAIREHLRTKIELDHDTSLKPSCIDDLARNEKYVGATWALIDVGYPTPHQTAL